MPFHEKNQNFEILRLEYLLNTCKYHAKNFFLLFFCNFEHIKTSFRRFKILVLTVDIKSPIYIYIYGTLFINYIVTGWISGLRYVSPAYLSGSKADVSPAVIYGAHVRYNTPHVHGIIRARSPSKVASRESSRARCTTHTHVNECERGSRLHYRVVCALAARTCRL